MAISEQQIIAGVKIGLGTLAGALPPPWGIALGAIAELIDPVVTAIEGGGQKDDVVAAVVSALVTASDADMKAELPPGS